MIKLSIKIILIWGASLLVIAVGTKVYPHAAYVTIASFLLFASSSLLGIISCFLARYEKRSGAKLVFLNFVLAFGVTSMTLPFYQLAMGLLFGSSILADFYFYEYNIILGSLPLCLCIFYLVADQILTGHSAYANYFATLAIAIGVCGIVFYPFLLDAKYLLTVPDYRNLKSIRQSITTLQREGSSNPDAAQIAARTQLTLADSVPKNETVEQVKERYVAQLLDFVPEESGIVLFYRPLWQRYSWLSLLTVFLIVSSILYQYFVDSPRGAYIEKIVWCLLLNCIFEALHLFSYGRAVRGDALDGIVNAGAYLSIGLYCLMVFLAGMRLRFLQTIEGNYYESRLLSDPTHISRWRDAFDNLVLKQFMNPGELDRRFLVQHRTQE